MTENPTIIFYTLEACSLCEKVDQWFTMLAVGNRYNIKKVDVVLAENSPELVEKFGAELPVIEKLCAGNTLYLKTPFGLLDLQKFLA